MEIILLLALILLNGAFAMSEIALVTARRARLQVMVETGDTAAAQAIKLGEQPTQFLSTIQIGITSIGILNGIVGEAVLAEPFALQLQTFGMSVVASGWVATILVVVVITYFSIVIGELVPKRLGQMSPEAIARLVARPMIGLAILTRPFVRLLSASTELILRVFGVRDTHSSLVTEEEIHAMLEEGSDAGVIEQHEHTMVRNVFRLDERLIASLMVPRSDIVFLDTTEPLEENLAKIASADHSRFPVCTGGWDQVLGIVTAKMILPQILKGEQPQITENLQPAVFVPETLTGMELLENFRSSGVHIALVVDEYGEVQGLVTLQDVLEAITGEFTPTNKEDAWAVQRDDGSWLLDGMIPIPELKDLLELRSVVDEDRGRYHTLSGMLMMLLGRVPNTADYVEWEEWRFEVVDMDGKRIDKVLVMRRPDVDG